MAAEGFLINKIDKLIGKLGSMAVEAWNVRYDVEKVVENMSEIKAVILDAEEQQQGANGHQVQCWLEKLKDTLYDADDLLDGFSTEHLRRQVMTKDKKAKKVRIFFSSSNQLLYSFKLAHKIKELRKTIVGLNVDRRIFNFTNRCPPEQRVLKQRETHSFIHEEEVIGREREKDELIESLLNTDMNVKENVSLISIIGIGGLGKTALAQLVYNDKVVQQHFELKMWVCIADNSNVRGFDLKGVAAKILESKSDYEIDHLQRELRKKVEGKRYLLVLDDIWNEERKDWLELMKLLVDGAKGSKIIITTRSKKVAKIMGTSSPLFLKGLNEEKSWRLFSQLAFENGKESENQNLVSIGREVVKKCAGVPLAIRSIGSVMYSLESEKDWSNFKDKDLVKIDEQSGNKVFQLIKLSYDHLPFHLKRCFAFCSLFPKDHNIEKTMLIRLWIAEGFVQSSDEYENIEDTADKYFMTFVQGSFFQDIKRDKLDNILCFKMHDLVHDLAYFVARNDCVMINNRVQQSQHIDKHTRHASFCCIFFYSGLVPISVLQANKLRTYLALSIHMDSSYETKSLEEPLCSFIMSSFKQIRVLKLAFMNSTMIPSSIGMLKHLRYLDLSLSRQIEVLPRSITGLYNLETLLLNYCTKLKELPKDLWKLTSLRHLELDHCDLLTCIPRRIGQLTNLQTLTRFVLDTTSRHSAAANELGELNNLRGELAIMGMQYLRCCPTKAKEMNLVGKSHLQYLIFIWDNEIDGSANDIEKDDIILQGLLPLRNIKVLKIVGFAGVGMAFSTSNDSFTNLNKLAVSYCTSLQYLPQSNVKDLNLECLPCLEWIVNNNNNIEGSSARFSPSSIRLFMLEKLKGWCRCSEEEIQRDCCHHLKSIDKLEIYSCPNLISFPQHMDIKRLVLMDVREKILLQVVNYSKVSSLCISRIDDLKSISKVLQHLPTLANLEIEDCKELDPCNDGDGCYSMKWKELKNLKYLNFKEIPKMKYLPEGLQHVATLRYLRITNCVNLTSIPEWVTSLQGVKIRNLF